MIPERFAGGVVLLAESSMLLQHHASKTLMRWGFEVLPAIHAADAIQLVEGYSGRIDFAIIGDPVGLPYRRLMDCLCVRHPNIHLITVGDPADPQASGLVLCMDGVSSMQRYRTLASAVAALGRLQIVGEPEPGRQGERLPVARAW